MPNERLRFVPDDIRRDLGEWLGDDFLEAYDLLCEAVYFGAAERDDVETEGNARRTAEARDFFFKDFGLWELKVDADRALRQIRSAVLRHRREGQRRRAPRSASHRRDHLGRTGGQGHRDGAVREAEA